MRLSLSVMLSLAGLQVLLASSVMGQSWEWVYLDFQVQEASLVEIFESIESQTEFVFMYGEDIIKHPATYTLQHTRTALKTILKELASQVGMELTLIDKTILVKLKPAQAPKVIYVEAKRKKVQGRVIDAQSREPLVGAGVQVKGSAQGSLTDAEGRFSLSVSPDAETLLVSAVLYKRQEVPISKQSALEVALIPKEALAEVMVIGYGQQSRTKVNGAISRVEGKTMNQY
ncbi:MAG: carboxypeptidase-like regulatory domain-containing protein, partial [Bacteroidota bacterium]